MQLCTEKLSDTKHLFCILGGGVSSMMMLISKARNLAEV